HGVPAGGSESLGAVVVVRVQVSCGSHSPALARHTAPALPAGCWQVVLVPLHWSSVQGLPSSGHAAPALPAGCVQALLVPSHGSRVPGLASSAQAVAAGCCAWGGRAVLDTWAPPGTSAPP